MGESRFPASKPPPFLPPHRNAAVMWVLDRMGPLVLRKVWRISEIEVSEPELQRLRSLRPARALTVGNHPTLAEPLVLYHPFRQAKLSYYVMTAWDTMVAGGRASAWFFQRIGCYSVRRGRRDRAAMEATERFLLQGERVVLFPEGQTYGLNDLLLPFQEGAFLMAFRAAEEMERRKLDAPLVVLPMAVKYIYLGSMLHEMDASLQRLEGALRVTPGGGGLYPRLRTVAEAFLAALERENGLTPAAGEDLDARIIGVRTALAGTLADEIKAEIPASADFPLLVQLLANALDDFAERSARGGPKLDLLRRQWRRLKTFVGFRDGYVAEWPTAERFLDVTARLEEGVLGRSAVGGLRRAVVRVGEPIDLRPRLAEYRSDRREMLARTTAEVEGAVRSLLEETSRERTRPLKELEP